MATINVTPCLGLTCQGFSFSASPQGASLPPHRSAIIGNRHIAMHAKYSMH